MKKCTACRSRLPRALSSCSVVLGSAWRARICASRRGSPASSALVIAACDVQLDVGSLDTDQRVELVAFAPGEPLPQLKRVQVAGPRGVAGREETAASWAVDMVAGWNGNRVVGVDMEITSRGDPHRGLNRARRHRGQATRTTRRQTRARLRGSAQAAKTRAR